MKLHKLRQFESSRQCMTSSYRLTANSAAKHELDSRLWFRIRKKKIAFLPRNLNLDSNKTQINEIEIIY